MSNIQRNKPARGHGLKSLQVGRVLAVAVGFTITTNVLSLGLPIYSMQIFDRVVPSASIPTLTMLTVIIIVVIATASIVDAARSSLLIRLSSRVDRILRSKLLEVTLLDVITAKNSMQAVETVRLLIGGPLAPAIMDLPLSSLFLIATFVLHPVLGLVTFGAIVFLSALSVVQHAMLRRSRREGTVGVQTAANLLQTWRGNTEVAVAMGFTGRIVSSFEIQRRRALNVINAAQDTAAYMEGLIRGVRSCLQVAMLATSAYLVLDRSVDTGTIVASSMLFSRVLAPFERVLGSTSFLHEGVLAIKAVRALLKQQLSSASTFVPPAVIGSVSAVGVSVYAENGASILDNISFDAGAGEVVVIVGAEGSGKTTLLRTLVGARVPSSGFVRYDGTKVGDFPAETLGSQIGYLPDEGDVFGGLVWEVISRGANADSADVIAAARALGAHDMIQALPKGYDTYIGQGGYPLSAGQRRRIAIARAVFKWPKVVILDEPTLHLDDHGETLIAELVSKLRARRTTVITVCRASPLLHLADRLLYLESGRVVLSREHEQIREFLLPRLAEVR